MSVAWQPIVSTRRGIIGYEAFLCTGEASFADPAALVTSAEDLGRLPEVGRRLRELAAEGFVDAPSTAALFINLHAQDLLDPALTAADAPLTAIASRVVLEITERASLGHVGDLRARIVALRELGFRIALDDLGGGYAGLGSIATLEPEFVKIDVGLVRDVHKSALRHKLIGAMTALCADLGTEVIAEGVELIEERDQILRLGCDLMQGNLFAPPGPLFHLPIPSSR
jgi:EAL domain-containing protein (putative c-di-GMP-specific phosphodiesterase class I)